MDMNMSEGAGIAITSCVHYAQGNATHTLSFSETSDVLASDLDSYAADALIHAFEDGAKDPESLIM